MAAFLFRNNSSAVGADSHFDPDLAQIAFSTTKKFVRHRLDRLAPDTVAIAQLTASDFRSPGELVREESKMTRLEGANKPSILMTLVLAAFLVGGGIARGSAAAGPGVPIAPGALVG